MTQDSSAHLQRALRLTIPAAALFSIPFGIRLHEHYGSMLGISINIMPKALLMWAVVMLCGGTICSSTSALSACAKGGKERPILLSALVLINGAAAFVALAGLLVGTFSLLAFGFR